MMVQIGRISIHSWKEVRTLSYTFHREEVKMKDESLERENPEVE